MKKLIASLVAVAGIGSIAQAQMEELSVSTTFAWESKYVFRGVELAEESFMPSVDLSYGGAYLGVWGAFDAESTGNEVDVYAGYGFEVSEAVALDVGFTYYTYPSSEDDFFDTIDLDDGTGANSLEFYFGASFDVVAAPAIYVYYDVHLETLTIEGSVGHSIALTDMLSLDLGGFIGHVEPDAGQDYQYYGVSADFAIALNDVVSASIGPRWSGSSEDTFDLDTFDDDNALWWGFSVTAGF